MCLKQKFKISFSEPIAFVLGKYSLIIHYLDMVNLRTAYLRVSAFASSGDHFDNSRPMKNPFTVIYLGTLSTSPALKTKERIYTFHTYVHQKRLQDQIKEKVH